MCLSGALVKLVRCSLQAHVLHFRCEDDQTPSQCARKVQSVEPSRHPNEAEASPLSLRDGASSTPWVLCVSYEKKTYRIAVFIAKQLHIVTWGRELTRPKLDLLWYCIMLSFARA